MLTNELNIRTFQTLFTDARFASMFNTVDRLHDVVCEGKLEQVTDLTTDEVIGWLRDIAYTINETISELDHSPQRPCWSDYQVIEETENNG